MDVDVRRPLRSLGLGAQQRVALARAVSPSGRVVVMDEPTSSLEPREVDTLFRVVRELRDQGVAITYVSHRLDELYRICDRVTVLRDGRVVHTGPLAGLDRLRLVSLMLGRDMAEVRRHGLTQFSEAHTAVTTEPVLRVRDLTKRHVLSDVSFDVRPGEVTGLGGLLGSGRAATVEAIADAIPIDPSTGTVAG